MITFDQIPGYAEAVEQEKLVRNASFLSIPENVGGFQFKQMTLEQFILLQTIEHPLICGKPCTVDDLTGFIWLMHVDYSVNNEKARKAVLKVCHAFSVPSEPRFFKRLWKFRKERAEYLAARMVSAIQQYLDETFQDAPGRSGKAMASKVYYSDAAGLCASFAREYGWPEEKVLSLPLKRLFQYLKEMREYASIMAGKNPILFNRSDRVLGEFVKSRRN